MTTTMAALRRDWRSLSPVPGFKLENVLGQGGQGVVFTASKLSTGRRYAIKFLDDAGSEAAQVRALASIHHPNLVAIEDFGQEGELVWIVYEHSGDQDLRGWMRGEEADLRAGLELLHQAGRGLEALHVRGLLHLDVKPSNIFLRAGHAKLGDYGLVGPTPESAPQGTFLRQGTVGYAAPEVVSGATPSPASDVHSLGRCLDALLEATDHAGGTPDPARPSLEELVIETSREDPKTRPDLADVLRRLAWPGQASGPKRPIQTAPVARPAGSRMAFRSLPGQDSGPTAP